MAEKNCPIEVFILFSSRRTVGGRGICVAQTCTDARSACKTAHVGTTCPTQRSKWLRRCAFSDLCRSSAVNLPPGGGIGARVLPASRILVPKCYACVLRRASFQNANSSLVCILVFFFSRYISRYANLKFEFLPCVVATTGNM